MKKVLHIVGNMNLGGQETFIMNMYRKIDRKEYRFDFVVHSNERGYFDDEIESLGGQIHRITRINSNPIKHAYQLYKILKENSYIAVHRHANYSIVFIDLLVAKICKVPVIITHSHSTSTTRSKFIHRIFRPLVNLFSTNRIACSKQAGEYMFGEKPFEVIENGIDTDKYLFNEDTRLKIREQLNFTSKNIVIGHVGRFGKEKNHVFIINLFSKLLANNDNYRLLLVGDGELKEEMMSISKELNIYEKIIFTGSVNNVNDYLQAMDIFVFPSLFEGFPISLLEAQISGLSCVTSTAIQDDSILSNHVKTIDLENIDQWLINIENLVSSNIYNRKDIINNKIVLKYDIKNTIRLCESVYNS